MRPWSALALGMLLTATAAAQQGSAPEIRFLLRHGDQTHELTVDREGLWKQEAAAILARHFPGETWLTRTPRYQKTEAWRTVELLSDPELRERLDRAARLGGAQRYTIDFNLTDSRDDLRAGERLRTPEGGSVVAEEGDTLASLAEDLGVTVDELVHANHQRFEVHPAAGWLPGGERRIFLGETGLSQGRWDVEETLLHEVGHVGDRSSCRYRDYGPDATHYHDEIVTPATAFSEGWANYQETLNDERGGVGGFFRGVGRGLGNLVGANGAPNLRIEGSEEAQGDTGVYFRLRSEVLTANDYLSNERAVARLLGFLEELPPGREGVEAAFVATQEVECRTVADLVAAWRRLHPGHDVALTEALRRGTYEKASDADLEALLDGALPRGQGRNELPRPRDPEDGERTWSDRFGSWVSDLFESDPEPEPTPTPTGGTLGQ